MENMITQTPAFNFKYFSVGEALKITERRKIFDALVVNISKDVLKVVKVEYESPMCGCAGYEPKLYNIFISEIIDGIVKIVKYNLIEE